MSKVLSREYTIEMPKYYVTVENEQMEYIDGGFYWNSYYWGIAARFSQQDCKNILLINGTGVPLISSIAQKMGGVAASIVTGFKTALASIGGSVLMTQLVLGSLNNGIYAEYNYGLGAGVRVEF